MVEKIISTTPTELRNNMSKFVNAMSEADTEVHVVNSKGPNFVFIPEETLNQYKKNLYEAEKSILFAALDDVNNGRTHSEEEYRKRMLGDGNNQI